MAHAIVIDDWSAPWVPPVKTVEEKKDGGFKPATLKQIAGWKAFMLTASPESWDAVLTMEKSAVEKYGDTKFVPADEERFMEMYVWPHERLTNLRCIARRKFESEQWTKFHSYMTEKSKSAHKELSDHVNKHGLLIKYLPEHRHEAPVETTVPKPGKRKKKVPKSDSSTSTISRAQARAAKVVTVQSYGNDE